MNRRGILALVAVQVVTTVVLFVLALAFVGRGDDVGDLRSDLRAADNRAAAMQGQIDAANTDRAILRSQLAGVVAAWRAADIDPDPILAAAAAAVQSTGRPTPTATPPQAAAPRKVPAPRATRRPTPAPSASSTPCPLPTLAGRCLPLPLPTLGIP